jgi:hypothetical protein
MVLGVFWEAGGAEWLEMPYISRTDETYLLALVLFTG